MSINFLDSAAMFFVKFLLGWFLLLGLKSKFRVIFVELPSLFKIFEFHVELGEEIVLLSGNFDHNDKVIFETITRFSIF
jgi:hypothetical protein